MRVIHPTLLVLVFDLSKIQFEYFEMFEDIPFETQQSGEVQFADIEMDAQFDAFVDIEMDTQFEDIHDPVIQTNSIIISIY